MRIILCIWLFLALGALSCTEQIEWELKAQEEEDLLVVDGKITDQFGPHEVRITRPYYEIDGTPEPVSGLRVAVSDGREIHPLTEDSSRPGVYQTGPDFRGQVNRGYQLRIQTHERLITAVAFMRKVDPFPFMRPFPVQEDPLLYELYISDQHGPAILRMDLDWSHLPGYDTLPEEETHALIYHYTLSSVDVNRIFPPERDRVWFPPGTRLIREKESVSREYEEYLRGMLSETDWRGGVFDVLPGNTRTNLSEGAIGYFTAGQVIRDTVIVE